MKKWILILLLIGVALYGLDRINKLREENNRLSNNIEALTTDISHWTTKNGIDVAKIQQLELTKQEYKLLYQEEVKKTKSLGIKVNRLEQQITAHSNTEIEATVPIVSDTVYLPSKIDTLPLLPQITRTFQYKDDWIQILGVIEPDSVKLAYNSTDSLDIYLVREPKRLLWVIPIGVKHINVLITNSNPNTKIVYAQSIRLNRRSR